MIWHVRNRPSSCGFHSRMKTKTALAVASLMLAAACDLQAQEPNRKGDRQRMVEEMRGRGQAPQPGQPAPAVSAKAKDGAVVDLAKPKRITVLVFGSHT